MRLTQWGLASMLALCPVWTLADQGKLLGTAGVSAIEGSAGGGLIPWATIGSYATREAYGATLSSTHARFDDYALDTYALSLGARDRVELSFGRLDFDVESLNLPFPKNIGLNVVGLKVRAWGDLIYGDAPLISLGLQHKALSDKEIARAVGADKTQGTDVYLSLAKAWIDGIAHHTTFVNVNLRHSEANEIGLLGFGGQQRGNRLLFEAAAGAFLTPQVALGLEFREKRGQLNALSEDHWKDLFVAWFPHKNWSLTAAWVDLGEVAGQSSQDGLYLSLQAAF